MSPLRRHRPAARAIPLGRLSILVQALLAVAFVAFLLRGDNVRLPLLHDSYEVQAAFDDASGLNGSDAHPVLIAGVRVGDVADVAYERGKAVATLELDADTEGRLRRDARATIVPRSALQDQTVELDPGRSREPLAEDAIIDVDRTRSPIELDRVISTLDADARAQLQILLGELAVGLRDRGTPLRAALAELAPALDSTGRVAAALSDRRRLLARLVGQLDRVFATLGDRRGALEDVLVAGRQTLETTGRRDRELADMTNALPGTLQAVGSALDEVRRLAAPLEPALEDLRPAARRLPAALRDVREIVPTARGLLDDLAPVVQEGRRPIRDLRAALSALGPASRELRGPVQDLLPVLRAVDENRDGISLLGERFSGVFSTNDVNGPILRGLGFFEEFNPANFGFPGAQDGQRRALAGKAVRALLKACKTNAAACLARYLVPGLPGAARTAANPLGSWPGGDK